jgi:selenocysteine-specific elongation factor
MQRDFVIGTAGHIDHGKTALIRALTGVDTDSLPQEKQRGITIDLGFAALKLANLQLAFVDVPGHDRFIRNMLAGATGFDLALFVVAGNDSVMAQTVEHFEILRLLGLRAGVIAISKCDLSEAGWLDLVENEVKQLVGNSFLRSAPIIRTSVRTGEGINALRKALQATCLALDERSDHGMFRLSVDRSFAVEGFGTVVTGTVASGCVSVADTIECWPPGNTLRVRGLQRHGIAVDSAARGTRVAINFAGVHHSSIKRGTELSTPGYLSPSHVVTVQLVAADRAIRPLRRRHCYRMHIGTREISAKLQLFDQQEVLPGQSAWGQLVVPDPLTVVFNQPFILRGESRAATLGGGVILNPNASLLRGRQAASSDQARELSGCDDCRSVELALERAGLAPLGMPGLVRATGLSAQMIESSLSELKSASRLLELANGSKPQVCLPITVVQSLEARILQVIAKRHAARPRTATLQRCELSAALADLRADGLVSSIIDRMLMRGQLVGGDVSVALAEHKPKLSQSESRLKLVVENSIRSARFAPPTLEELIARTQAGKELLMELLALLVEEGSLVQLGGGLWIDAQTEAELRILVTKRLSESDLGLSMAELRDLLDTTRKYAVPIGEYLDRVGLTRRVGELRVLSGLATRTEE